MLHRDYKILRKFYEDHEKTVLGLLMVAIYLSFVFIFLPSTGIVWDETRHLSGAKARGYSIYAAVSGAEDLEMCSIENEPTDPETVGRCWDGRPRISKTFSGIMWGALWYLNGKTLDVLTSIMIHKLSTVIFVSLCIFFVFRFATEAFNRRVGIFSALSLIFIPRFFAHSMYTTLDAPVASMILISVYFFWKGMKSRKWAIAGGVVFGLTLSSKINAYFVPPIIIIWLLVSYRDRIFSLIKDATKGKINLRKIPFPIFTFAILSPLFMVISWPWLWKNTFYRYFSYMGFNVAHEETLNVFTYYLGHNYIILPWHYTWIMTAVTVPVFILVFMLIGSYRAIKDTVTLDNRITFLIFSGAFFPILFFSTDFANPHDGLRTFLNIFPFIAILSGLGADMCLNLLKNRRLDARISFIMIILLISIPSVYALGMGMPYAVSYYNHLIGGTRGAYESGMELDYYAESYLRIALWLNENAKEGAIVYVPKATNILEMYKYGDIGLISERIGEGRHGLEDTEVSSNWFDQEGLLRHDIDILWEWENETSDYTVILNRLSVVGNLDENGEKTAIHMTKYIENCEPLFAVEVDEVPVSMIYDTDCTSLPA